MASVIDSVRTVFNEKYGKESLLVRAPGRVNLIGEHTDYNEGFVLPAAVDRAIYLAIRPSTSNVHKWASLDLGQDFEVSPGSIAHSELGWPNYLQGILAELSALDIAAPPVELVFGGDIPIGSGMSSSAALTTGFAFALDQLFGFGLDRVEIAKMGQRAENNFVGNKCGIMDQFASMLGREKTLLQLDCRSLACTFLPFRRSDVRIVLCNSHVKHSLAASEYNVRRSQCEKGVEAIKPHYPNIAIASLRDVTFEMLKAHRQEMDDVIYRRCAYVIAENLRVLAARFALSSGNLEAFGEAMNHSHYGLRDSYEVSCRELDILQSAAEKVPGVFGSRMMGGGFGGCTINLVEEQALANFQKVMGDTYLDVLAKEPIIHVCQLKGGTEVLA